MLCNMVLILKLGFEKLEYYIKHKTNIIELHCLLSLSIHLVSNILFLLDK